jgi:hypothetical protein
LPVLLTGLTGAQRRWWRPLPAGVRLATGTPAPAVLRVPVAAADQLLKQTVRLVADLPAKASGDVVWSHGDNELLVRTDAIALGCAPGLVTVAVPVSCDQMKKEALVTVPFAVGSAERAAGLVMSSFAQPAGPEIVVSLWADALTAFAWEAILHLAQQLSASVGKDGKGLALVPGSIAAERDLLLVQPMARHDLGRRAT